LRVHEVGARHCIFASSNFRQRCPFSRAQMLRGLGSIPSKRGERSAARRNQLSAPCAKGAARALRRRRARLTTLRCGIFQTRAAFFEPATAGQSASSSQDGPSAARAGSQVRPSARWLSASAGRPRLAPSAGRPTGRTPLSERGDADYKAGLDAADKFEQRLYATARLKLRARRRTAFAPGPHPLEALSNCPIV
jgi:hypothetical protein